MVADRLREAGSRLSMFSITLLCTLSDKFGQMVVRSKRMERLSESDMDEADGDPSTETDVHIRTFHAWAIVIDPIISG